MGCYTENSGLTNEVKKKKKKQALQTVFWESLASVWSSVKALGSLGSTWHMPTEDREEEVHIIFSEG